MLTDYHVHTEFSDDSREPMETQVRQGIALGLAEMCFTDHVDYGVKKDWDEGDIEYYDGNPSHPKTNVDYPKYFAKFREVSEACRGRIELRCGLEFGVQTGTIPRYDELLSRYGEKLDFVLLSIHQVDNRDLWTQSFQRGRTQKECYELYYQELYDVMKSFHGYSVLAHLDLIARYDKQGNYPFSAVRDMVAEILKLAISDGKGIELNTSSWRYKLRDTTPSRDILRLYRDLGGKIITIGSDAHSARDLGNRINEAREILKNEIGFSSTYTFRRMEPEGHRI